MTDNIALFLREFTKEIMLNVPSLGGREEFIIKEKAEGEDFEKSFTEILSKFNVEKPQIQKIQQVKPIIKQKPITYIKPIQQVQPRFQPRPIQARPSFQPQQIQPIPIQIKPQISPEIKSLETQDIKKSRTLQEIKNFFNDPKVIIVECPGPDKFILIKTATRVMTTRIKLSERDIREIIESISRETKIPIVAGLFKAIKENLMTTAIISDMAGSRFMIKRLQLF